MEGKNTFRPLSVEEQKKLMAENVSLRQYNENMAKALQNYQTGFAIRRVDWLFNIVEDKGLVFDDATKLKAVEEIKELVWPTPHIPDTTQEKENEGGNE